MSSSNFPPYATSPQSSLLFCCQWDVGLWGSLCSPYACSSQKRKGDQWEMGAVEEFSLLPPEDYSEMQFLCLPEDGWSHEIEQTFALRTPHPHLCFAGIFFNSKVIELETFVWGSAFWELQIKISTYCVPGTLGMQGTRLLKFITQRLFSWSSWGMSKHKLCLHRHFIFKNISFQWFLMEEKNFKKY